MPADPVVPTASPPVTVRAEIVTVAVGAVILSTPSPDPVCSIVVADSPAPVIVVSSEIDSGPPADPAPPSEYVPVPRAMVEPAFWTVSAAAMAARSDEQEVPLQVAPKGSPKPLT